MTLYLGSLLSEFVPGEAQYNHGELSERSLYTVPNTSPPQLVQLVRMDSNDTVCPLVTVLTGRTCDAHSVRFVNTTQAVVAAIHQRLLGKSARQPQQQGNEDGFHGAHCNLE